MATAVKVPYTYLPQQFGGVSYQVFNVSRGERQGTMRRITLGERILERIAEEMQRGLYTLGPSVQEFEEAFAAYCGVRYAVGVNSGTDALFLLMKALGVGPGDGVITVPNTFVATVGAIIATGAHPVFMDIGDDYLMLPEGQFRPLFPPAFPPLASYPKFRIPVHWGGNVAYSPMLHIEDACQAVGASYKGQKAGSLGVGAAFSLHPLKNLNVMGDGGVVTTNDEGLAQEIRLLRNHGLQDRDTCIMPGYNSRLDTIQAIVGLEVLKDLYQVTIQRQINAKLYDEGLHGVKEIVIPFRDPGVSQVYHLYQIEAERRDELLAFLHGRGIEAKVHYPIPLHLQPGFKALGYQAGDFPRAEAFAANHLSLPIHQYLSSEQLDFVIEAIRDFYR